MRCNECGYSDNQDWDLEPVVFEADRQHPNYDAEHDAISTCPECLRRTIAASDAAYQRYMSGVEYACGIRD